MSAHLLRSTSLLICEVSARLCLHQLLCDLYVGNQPPAPVHPQPQSPRPHVHAQQHPLSHHAAQQLSFQPVNAEQPDPISRRKQRELKPAAKRIEDIKKKIKKGIGSYALANVIQFDDVAYKWWRCTVCHVNAEGIIEKKKWIEVRGILIHLRSGPHAKALRKYSAENTSNV